MRITMEDVEAFVQVFARVILTGVLVFIAGAFAWQAIRLWTQRALVLAPFDYAVDGQPKSDGGEQFSRMVRADLVQLTELYNLGETPNAGAVPTSSSDPAVPMEIPAEFDTSFLESVELKAYGLEFGTLFKSLRRQLESPREITGTVSQQGGQFTVFAEVKDRDEDTPAQRWSITHPTTLPEATRNVACRVFRYLALRNATAKSGNQMLKSVSDEEFCLFTHALSSYEQYRARKTFLTADEATKLIAQASKPITQLLASEGVSFPYVHKLAALVYFEEKKFDRAETEIDVYGDWLTRQNDGQDRKAEKSLVAELKRETRRMQLQTIEAMRRARPLRPGVYSGVAGANDSAGLICCIVRDKAGQAYLLSVKSVAGTSTDAKIIQPATRYGGDEADVVAVHVKTTSTAAIARLDPALLTIPRILGLGAISGIRETPTKDSAVFTLGPDGNRFEGKVSDYIKEGVPLGKDPTGPRTNGAILVSGLDRNFVTGAPVVDADNKLVGMALGPYTGFLLVIPIKPTLDELELELVK
jgi:hypothetical protein